MQDQRHTQVQQQIGLGSPGGLWVVELLGLLDGLQVVHDLPDPRGDSQRAPEKRQHRAENLPGRLAVRRPAFLHIGHRLPGRQFDQRVGIGGE